MKLCDFQSVSFLILLIVLLILLLVNLLGLIVLLALIIIIGLLLLLILIIASNWLVLLVALLSVIVSRGWLFLNSMNFLSNSFMVDSRALEGSDFLMSRIKITLQALVLVNKILIA